MKKYDKIIFIFSFLILTFFCSRSDDPISSNEEKYELEKYKVYSDIINTEFSGLIYIHDSTASGYWIQNYEPSYLPDTIQSFFPGLKFETIENYKFLNQTKTKLKDKFNLSLEYNLIPLGVDINLSTPSGLISSVIDLTNVAFDESYSQAILYFGYNQTHGGSGRFLYLEKNENTWTMKNQKYMWAHR